MSSTDTQPKLTFSAQDAIQRPRKSLGRLFFSQFGSVFDGRYDSKGGYLGGTRDSSVASLLREAVFHGWTVARLPRKYDAAVHAKAVWSAPLGILVFKGEDFFAGRQTTTHTQYENAD